MAKITLDAADTHWLAESFQSGIVCCFHNPAPKQASGNDWRVGRTNETGIHIQSLSFNGRKVFDHRVPKGWSPSAHLENLSAQSPDSISLPTIPELKPITLKVAQLSAPEMTKGGAA